MVSANAVTSSARIFFSSSKTSSFEAQFFFKSAAKALSLTSDFAVSVLSLFISAISMLMSPNLSSFSMVAWVSARSSSFFARINSSYDLTAASSVAAISFKSWAISSSICLRMPTISPLAGAYSPLCSPDRNDNTSRRSPSSFSWFFTKKARNTPAKRVCKKLPAMPFSKASTALDTDSWLALVSANSLSKAVFSFSRSAVASSTAAFAACLSASWEAKSFSS
mmetsp:Transcript_143712/g.364797  ORF Transcript_143712/g.364797 Transcript_143712/m.364797 type:complete len:223 (+) Transcript_143712:183-851(+)